MNTHVNPVADPRELHRLRTFYLGPSGAGDLRLGFAIDGRDYTDPDQIRVDVAAAVSELHDRGLAAQMFTEPVTPDTPRASAPTWAGWAATHPRPPRAPVRPSMTGYPPRPPHHHAAGSCGAARHTGREFLHVHTTAR